MSSPVLADGKLFVGSGSGWVYALDVKSGRQIWSTDAGARVRTTPAVANDLVIVGTMAGQVLALRKSDGKRQWTFATEGAAHDFSMKDNDTSSVVTAPIVVADTVVVGGRDGKIYGIDLRSGKERWRETHDGSSWILGLTADERRFYAGSGSAFIVQAADPVSGKEIWRSPTRNAMFGGLAKAGDVLVSNGSNGTLFAFDASTGAQLWRFKLPDSTFASPLVAKGLVVTGSDDGSVFAINTSDKPGPSVDHLVYSFTNQPAGGFFWFKPEITDYINGAFAASGYRKIGTADLATALQNGRIPSGRKVIIIADTRLPDGVDGSRLRHFLDDGGVLVLIGPNPVGWQFDKDGTPVGIDPDKAAAAFSIAPEEKERDFGYNVSNFTANGRALGFSGHFVSVGWARPGQVSVVLAADRSGMATAWVKRFANGGLLIDLPLPRTRAVDLSTYMSAIDLAVARSEAGSL